MSSALRLAYHGSDVPASTPPENLSLSLESEEDEKQKSKES